MWALQLPRPCNPLHPPTHLPTHRRPTQPLHPHALHTAASYNPTVALLESSSLAQIHMLSFGMKLRFGAHLAVNFFHFAAAVAADDQICAAGLPFIPGGACNALLVAWQVVACFGLPCALVYASERRSRRIFLEAVSH